MESKTLEKNRQNEEGKESKGKSNANALSDNNMLILKTYLEGSTGFSFSEEELDFINKLLEKYKDEPEKKKAILQALTIIGEKTGNKAVMMEAAKNLSLCEVTDMSLLLRVFVNNYIRNWGKQ